MAEPVFKLLRCDAEASHMLGWAKKEVRRLVDFAHLDAFNRTWKFGDVSVRAQYFGGVARLWLAAAGTERMAVWATLPNPVPWRGLSIARAAGAGGEKVFVIASDGEVLAQEALDIYLTNETDRAFVPEGQFTGIGSFLYPWNGSSRTAMYFNGSSTLQFDHWLDFVVPEDVAFVPAEAPPAQAGVTAVAVFTGSTYEYVPFGGSGGSAVPLASISSRTDEWVAGVKEAKARRAAWFKKNSDEALQTLQDGILPEQWDYRLKYYAPESTHTYRPVVLSASYDDKTLSDTSANLTQVGTQVQERTVEFTYVITVDGVPETREETVTGTLTSVVTAHKDADDNPVVHSLMRTYDEWYAPAAAPAGTEALLPHQFLKDGTAYGMGLVWNGVVHRAYGGTFPSPTVGNWEYYADSTMGAPGNGLYPFAESGYNPPISAAEVSPAYPPESNTLEGTAPAFVRTYHADVKPQYRASGGNTEWLSSSLMPGMTVTVVPIAPVLEDAPLGIYGEPEVAEVAEVEIYGSAVFSYDYNLGEFVFVEWKPLPGGAESARIPTPVTEEVPDGWNGFNALLIYGGIKWDDVKETAKAQRKALADPNDPAHDPLMKAVLDALTPQE